MQFARSFCNLHKSPLVSGLEKAGQHEIRARGPYPAWDWLTEILFVPYYPNLQVNTKDCYKKYPYIDNELEGVGIDLVKISDEGIEEDYDECDRGLPCLVHFKYAREPQVYYGSLADHSEVSAWIDTEAKRQ